MVPGERAWSELGIHQRRAASSLSAIEASVLERVIVTMGSRPVRNRGVSAWRSARSSASALAKRQIHAPVPAASTTNVIWLSAMSPLGSVTTMRSVC
jgi:hypothetical protein